MEKLSGHRALDLATRAVPILKHLAISGKTMSLKEFGQALGLVHQAWKPWHHQQLNTVLSIVQATFVRLDEPQLDYDRITCAQLQEGHWYRGYWSGDRRTQ
jgi:hypothetical protein